MVQIIKGIVLDSFKFKETSLICHLYSLEYGMMSVLVSGLGKAKSSSGQIYYQPLTIIEFSVHYKERKGILRASDVNLIYSPNGILPEMNKMAISFFIAEIILKTCKEKEQDTALFQLLLNTIHLFEEEVYSDLHLFFLVQYIHLLGFSLKDNGFINQNGALYGYDQRIESALIHLSSLDVYTPLAISKAERLIVIRFILKFMEINTGLTKLKSLQVLEDIFS